MFTWAQRRKLAVFAGFFAIIAVIAIFFVLKIKWSPEEITPKAEKPSILWSRFFEVRDGFLDVATLLRNPNNSGVQKIIYSFKIYDKYNILIAIQEGEALMYPSDKFIIFEPNVPILERVPSRVLFDIKEVLFNEEVFDSLPKIDVLGTERFLEDVFPKVSVHIKSRDDRSLENVEGTVVLFDENQNAVAVSSTIIPFLGIGEEKIITFTWPKALNDVSTTEVFFKNRRK